MQNAKKPVMLMIMDGIGIGDFQDKFNAVERDGTCEINKLLAQYPHAMLACAGEAVGLPEGQMGNSEVGHLNLGAGRVVYQEFTRISKAIRTDEFFQNKAFSEIMAKVKKAKSRLHLFGLLSDGGVHSHITHLYALLKMAKQKGLKDVFVHAFLDGRDVPPNCAVEYIDALEAKMQEIGVGKIATVSGRYYPMDRDKRWERVEKGYDAIVLGEGLHVKNARDAVLEAYERGENDEFVMPTVVDGVNKKGIIENDGIIFYNFRPDRARQISHVFVDEKFDGFVRKKGFFKVFFATMTQYDETLPVEVAFEPQVLKNILSEVLAKNSLKQLRIAETEKYAHVTYFFNGGEEKPFSGEERILVQSPKVATYDLKPSMSALEVTEKVLEAINSDKYDVIIMNYANGDMVGHTGVFEAAKEAVHTVDACVGKVAEAILQKNGSLMITADHGNAEEMWDYTNDCPQTAHTTNPVPFILVSDEYRNATLREDGKLADVAPTLLFLCGLKKPKEMDGENLIIS